MRHQPEAEHHDGKDSKVNETFWNGVPRELLKSLGLEARVGGAWIRLGSIDRNQTRLVRFAFDRLETTAIRIRIMGTYGCENAKLFEIRCYES